jgi:hypothetical protein
MQVCNLGAVSTMAAEKILANLFVGMDAILSQVSHFQKKEASHGMLPLG